MLLIYITAVVFNICNSLKYNTGTTFRLFFMQLHLTVCPFFLFYACTNVKHELHVPTLYHYHDVVVEFYDYDHPPPFHPQCHRHYQLLCFSF